MTSIAALMRFSQSYAGIGSRKTPKEVLSLMERLGELLARKGLTLRSGAAPGADTAFESGCDLADGKKTIFLPWKGFNESVSSHFPPSELAEMLASLCHPNWKMCSQAARKLHARNCHQVLGKNLDHPVDFILFWAPEVNGTVMGGTATAIFLAKAKKIPVFNLWEDHTREIWQALVDADEQRRRSFWTNLFRWLDRREMNGREPTD